MTTALGRRLTKLEQEANPGTSVADAIRQVDADRQAGITRPRQEYVPGRSRIADLIHERRMARGEA
jgi:hypothetical protein